MLEGEWIHLKFFPLSVASLRKDSFAREANSFSAGVDTLGKGIQTLAAYTALPL